MQRLKIRWLISTVSFYSQTWHCRLGLKAGLSCLRRRDLRLSKVSWHNIVQGKVSRTGLLRKAHLDSLRVCRIKVNIQFTLWGIEKSSSHSFFIHWPWSLTAFFLWPIGFWKYTRRARGKDIHIIIFSRFSGLNVALFICKQLRIHGYSLNRRHLKSQRKWSIMMVQ